MSFSQNFDAFAERDHRGASAAKACVRVLVVDNYDSFTYNLVQAIDALGAQCIVRRNDCLRASAVADSDCDAVLISPGPGRPEAAGSTLEIVAQCAASRRPLLGVCLGHQAIARTFGGRIRHAREVMHGKTCAIHHREAGVFRGLPNPFDATRYHSLAVDPAELPPELEVTAWTSDDEVMGLRHRTLPIEGVQFHPESICTPAGQRLLGNFLTSVEAQR